MDLSDLNEVIQLMIKESVIDLLISQKVVTSKSTISDMVIDAIVKNRTRAQPAVNYRDAQ